ncbi:MAG TPA: efflux transporter outer membrane subunit [Steroidobacteraceae bacterium]|nr:efflux transporter outer membrane subunit [Steroidobacteraceae bacterium]
MTGKDDSADERPNERSRAGGRSIAYVCACLALPLASCTYSPLAERPSLPSEFEHRSTLAAQWPAADWYTQFGSDELSRLIQEARDHNLDLAAAIARTKQADAHARAAGAALLPQIDVGPSVTYAAGKANGRSAHETDWSVLANASYEVDFWGKNAAARNSAQFAALASHTDEAVVALTVATSVASEYFNVLSLHERVELARDNLRSSHEVLDAIEARFNAGAASAVELSTQRAAVANAELAIAPLEQQETEARGALAILLGQPPEGFVPKSGTLNDLTEPRIGAGLPSELLTRRPDIVSAEANLEAAHADLTAARSALFPAFTLSIGAGVRHPALDAAVTTLEGTGPSISATAALVQTIFDHGLRRAANEEAAAKEEELLANYRKAILDALLDVESAAASIEHLNAQQQAQSVSLEQSMRAYEAARLRYQAGSGDFLTVLEAQRSLYAARDQNSQYRLARLQALVTLFKALGGGWHAAE